MPSTLILIFSFILAAFTDFIIIKLVLFIVAAHISTVCSFFSFSAFETRFIHCLRRRRRHHRHRRYRRAAYALGVFALKKDMYIHSLVSHLIEL